MKKLIALALAVTLTGCATTQTKSGVTPLNCAWLAVASVGTILLTDVCHPKTEEVEQ
jgi:uncharacterized lipoprotein NlpE involved in copper resistance